MASRKRRVKPKVSADLGKKIAALPAHQRKAIAEWLDPKRFRRAGGR